MKIAPAEMKSCLRPGLSSLLVIFFSSVKSVYFNQFFGLNCIQAVAGSYQTICWKNTRYRSCTSRAYS